MKTVLLEVASLSIKKEEDTSIEIDRVEFNFTS